VTPAVPRYLSVLAELLDKQHLFVLDWPLLGSDAGRAAQEQRANVKGHQFAIQGRSIREYIGTVSWFAKITKELLVGGYSLVQPSDVFCMLPCIALKNVLGFRLVADIRDPVSSANKGASWGRFRNVLAIIEKLSILIADRVIIVDENRRSYLPKSVRHSSKVLVVRNLPDHDYYDEIERPTKDSSRLVINYSGYLSLIRGARMLSQVAKDISQVRVDVVGETRDVQVKNLLSDHTNIRLIERVSHHRSLELMIASDLVSLLYDPTVENNRVAAPNKFYEAMMLGLPCLTCHGTPMAEIVERYKCGYIVDYDDVDNLRKVCEELLADRKDLLQRGVNARNYYLKNCCWEVEKVGINSMYEELLEMG